MGVLLGLVAAVCYGTSDFVAGLGSRRGDPGAVTLIAQPFSLLAAVLAVLVLRPAAPDAAALWWGAASGVGGGIGTVALYRGLAVGRMSVVAPASAVLAAALPALTGVLLGDRLPALSWVGVVVALPAVLLVSVHRGEAAGGRLRSLGYGLGAGIGFAVLFIGLARAGTAAGAWPLVPGQLVAVATVVAVFGRRRVRARRPQWSRSWRPATLAGILAAAANLGYLAATGYGQLAVVAVLTSLYPAATVVLAVLITHERVERAQAVGLLAAAAAVVLIVAG